MVVCKNLMLTQLALQMAFCLGERKANILMIASDDMRPEMSPYGHEYMQTPHLQKLADDGFTFKRCYVQQALCAPSRTVLLTGRRPDTSRVWTIGPYFRDTTGKDWTSLPQFFKQNGYRSIGHGKIFHEGNASGFPLDQDQEYGAWSVPFYHPPGDGYDAYTKAHPPPPGLPGKYHAPFSNLAVDAEWETFNDAHSALRAVEWIANASEYTAPFFLAVGFHRPHIPYIYPKEFEFTADLTSGPQAFPPDNYYITKDVPVCAPHDWTGEGDGFGDLFAIRPSITNHTFEKNLSSLCTAVPATAQRAMKRSYFSCIQYIDHLVGQLVSALTSANLYEKTHIVFWGDHGYKLGEHCDWFKHDNYEQATRIPLIFKPAAGMCVYASTVHLYFASF
jgi:iduronate 2-sulfatase